MEQAGSTFPWQQPNVYGEAELFAGLPDQAKAVSLEIDGEKLCVAGNADIADFMNDALLKGKVQVFGLALGEELLEIGLR